MLNMPKDVIEIERDRILQKLRSECNRMSEWLHFNIPVAVHNPPSTSQDGATMCPDHIRPMPTIIMEVTMNITKLAAFSNFPHMFL